MTSFTKNISRLLPLGIVLLIYTAVYHSLNDYKYTDEESTIKLQVSRHQRAISSTTHYCKFNQYYDQEEKRCLGVPGGGKVLHVENGRSCGVNILKPHCTSSLYYHICKHDKSILAQCANRQIFDSRLQRCAYYDSSRLTPSTIRPDDYEHVDVLKSLPNCTRLGQFPVPDHCSMFYTCNTNGHRLHQSVFKCPRNMGYQADRQICAVVTDCENNDSVDSTVCVPDAPGENVESLNSEEAINGNVKETTEIPEESETERSVSDSVLKTEENINSNIHDDIISTSESIIDNPLSMDNYGDNGDLYKVNSSPTQSIQDISTSDGTSALNPTESAREIQNEKDDSVLDLRITSPPTIELHDNTLHSIMTPMTSTPVYNTDMSYNVDTETTDITPFSTVSYKSSKLDDRTQDMTTELYNDDKTVTLPHSNIETFDSFLPTTMSNIPFSSITDKSLKVDEETRDMTEAVDSYQTSTISNVPESSPIIDRLPKLYEETQDTTEEYRNNDDKIMALPNSNIEATDAISTISSILEFPPISETSSKLYEEMQSATTEQYKNDDRIMTPNSNIKMVDQNPILSDISVTTNNPNDDFDTSTLTSTILSPQADINDDQYTKELFKTSPSVDSKLVDPNLDVPEAIENVSTGYSSEHIDTLDLTTKSPPALEHITTQMDITTITPIIQELPVTSDTDPIIQNGKDNTEASPFIEQDAPITTTQMDITTIVPTIQDLPATSDTDSIIQNDKDNTEASPFVEQNVPITTQMDITTITPTIKDLPATSDTDPIIQNDKDNTEASPFVEQNVPITTQMDITTITPTIKDLPVTSDTDPIIQNGKDNTEASPFVEQNVPITTQMDITTITPTIKDLPVTSDTDPIIQNGKDNTEASPFIEQDAPITTTQMDITTIAPTIQDLPATSDTDPIIQNGKDNTEASPFIEQDALITTTQMDITTIPPTIQDLPATSDTDPIIQNGKDNTEASPFIEQDAPITTTQMDITTITPTIKDLPATSDTDPTIQNDKDNIEASPFVEQDAPITDN